MNSADRQAVIDRAGKEYAALLPVSRFGKSLDAALSRWAPQTALKREQGRRAVAMYRAQGAIPNSGRENAFPGWTGETFQTERERKQLMWNALDALDNSGLAESITSKLALFTAGSLRFQARTGDAGVNSQHEALVRERTGARLDITGRHSLRQMAMLTIRGCVVKGGQVFNWVRPEPDSRLYLQGIEYDRIGSPWDQRISNFYVGGITLDNFGREVAFDIYDRDKVGGMYWFREQIPTYDDLGRRKVHHLFQPKTMDQYRGETAFKTVIDLIHAIPKIRQFEIEAMEWAATQTAVYYTNTGELPDRPFQTFTTASGAQTRIYNVHGPEIQSLEVGEDAKMFEHQRPSPNVIALWMNCVKEICIATGLPMTFVYGMDANGPGVRFDGAQAARAIRGWWDMLVEKLLAPTAEILLSEAIANGEIPYHPLFRNGRWIGPADISIDAGYDSAAMVNENREGLRTGAEIAMERGEDIDEIHSQLGIEADGIITVAKAVAARHGIANWETVLPMIRQGGGAAGGIAPTIKPPEPVSPKDPNAGATSGGTEMD